MKAPFALCLCGVLLVGSAVSAADNTPVRVTVDNFCRAETDGYFAKFVKDGGFGKVQHERELAPIDKQTVIRMNRDTLYSFGVFDLDAAPIIVTLPDAGKRYMAVQVINEDHYSPFVFYAPARHSLSKKDVGTRYVALAIRTFVNPNDAADVKAVHALQDKIQTQQASAGKYAAANWDPESLKKIRESLLGVVAANGELDSSRMFGRKDQVDQVQHLLGTAAGWGGNPRYAAIYAGVTPQQNDGKTPFQLTIKDVPVDGFWSISVYNKAGFFEKNKENAYTINNVTAKRNADGSVIVHFGGSDTNASNYIPITPGWNYIFRLYRPRKELLEGKWKPPVAEVVK